MAKPVLLLVDDDPTILRTLGRELRRHHADRFRVLHADSGGGALQVLHDLARRNAPVARGERAPAMTARRRAYE